MTARFDKKNDNSDSPVPITKDTRPIDTTPKGGTHEGQKGGGKK